VSRTPKTRELIFTLPNIFQTAITHTKAKNTNTHAETSSARIKKRFASAENQNQNLYNTDTSRKRRVLRLRDGIDQMCNGKNTSDLKEVITQDAIITS